MAEVAPFDASQYAVVVGPSAVSLRPDLEELGAPQLTAHLVPWDAIGDGDPMAAVGSAIATISWQSVRFSAVVDAGEDPFVFADSVSGDLLEVTRILLDEQGMPREFAGAAGNDLLYFTSVTVKPGHDFFRVAVELLEHVIGAHRFGCFGAAYYRDQTPRLELERALRDRGFALVEDEPLFFVSLERRRPELRAEP